MLSKDNINKIKEAIIIEGPDDVLNSKDENSPNNNEFCSDWSFLLDGKLCNGPWLKYLWRFNPICSYINLCVVLSSYFYLLINFKNICKFESNYFL